MLPDVSPYPVSVAANLIEVFETYTIESRLGLGAVGVVLTGHYEVQGLGLGLMNCWKRIDIKLRNDGTSVCLLPPECPHPATGPWITKVLFFA